MVGMMKALKPGHLRNTCQYTAKSRRETYLVQVAWPLSWSHDRIPAEADDSVSLVYLVDGNEYFFTAVDIAHRLEFTNNGCKAIVVGVGYPPPCSCVHNLLRREPDLTAPSGNDRYKPLIHSEDEAHQFLEFIREDVIAFVEGKLFSHLSIAGHHTRRALYGNSHGGLFSLCSLYANSTPFDTIIAVSATVWRDDFSIVKYQERLFREQPPPVGRGRAVSLILAWGSTEADFPSKNKSQDASRRGVCDLEEEEMGDSMLGLIDRLKCSRHMQSIRTWKFTGENHDSVAVNGLQHGLSQFLLGQD